MGRFLGIAWNALLTSVVITLLVGLFVAAMPPVYQATAIVRGGDDDMLQLQSGSLMDEVVRTTSVDASALRGWLERLVDGGGEVDKVALLQRKLSITRGEKDDWINISVEAQDARAAVALADDIAREYSRQRMRKILTHEERVAARESADMAAAELAMHFEQDKRLLDYPSALRELETNARQFEQKISASVKEVTRLSTVRTAAMNRELGTLTEPGVIRSQQSLTLLETRRAGLKVKYGPAHQKMTTVNAELQQAKIALHRELDAFVLRSDQRISVQRGYQDQFSSEIAKITQSIEELKANEVTRQRLRLQHENTLAQLEGVTQDTAIEMFANAVLPRNTLGSNQLLLLLLVFVAGFVLIFVVLAVAGLSHGQTDNHLAESSRST